ncbi:hypothetical protein D3C75_1221810 [compost metagenome]
MEVKAVSQHRSRELLAVVGTEKGSSLLGAYGGLGAAVLWCHGSGQKLQNVLKENLLLETDGFQVRSGP